MTGTVIIGAGPAGAAAAITLARAGHRPLLIEREAVAAEKVCGEFLAADAAALLERFGLDLAALGAVPIAGAAIAAGRRAATLALPFAAWGLPRAALDAALRDQAVAAGAQLRIGTVVQALPCGAGWRLRLRDTEIEAARVILATGKHELRGVSRAVAGGAIGVKLPLRGVPIGKLIALLGCAGGYAGLQPRMAGGANLCAALDPRAGGVATAARDARALLEHVMRGSSLAATLLRDAEPLLLRPMTIAGVPYGFIARDRSAGLYRAGDQAAVIPSLCGDGVAMALASGIGAAEAMLAGQGAASHHAGFASRIRAGMRLASLAGFLIQHAPGLLVLGARAAPGVAVWAARRTRMA